MRFVTLEPVRLLGLGLACILALNGCASSRPGEPIDDWNLVEISAEGLPSLAAIGLAEPSGEGGAAQQQAREDGMRKLSEQVEARLQLWMELVAQEAGALTAEASLPFCGQITPEGWSGECVPLLTRHARVVAQGRDGETSLVLIILPLSSGELDEAQLSMEPKFQDLTSGLAQTLNAPQGWLVERTRTLFVEVFSSSQRELEEHPLTGGFLLAES